VSAGDWFSILYKRDVVERNNDDERINFVRADTEQLDVAWAIINQLQQEDNGDIGITRSNPAENSGKDITVRFNHWERTKAADALRTLTEAENSFDFSINPEKEWITYYPERGVDSDIVFEIGKNIEKLSYAKDASQVASRLSGLGGGSDRNRCIVVAEDVEALATYGLLEESVDFSEVKNYDRLAEMTRSTLRTMRRPLWQPTLTAVTNDPPFGSYELGDRIRIRARDGFHQIDRKFRLIAINMNLEDEGTKETFELYFDEASVGP
jgi:hypothetical protein